MFKDELRTYKQNHCRNPRHLKPYCIFINSLNSYILEKNTEKTYREDFSSCNTLSVLHVFSKTTCKCWKEKTSHHLIWNTRHTKLIGRMKNRTKQNINNGRIFLCDWAKLVQRIHFLRPSEDFFYFISQNQIIFLQILGFGYFV